MGIEVMGKNGNGNAVLESEWVGMGIIRWEWERNENKKVGPLTSPEIGSGVWGTPANFNGFRVLAALLHGTLVVGVSQILRVEQRAPPTFGRAAIKLGICQCSS